MSENIIITINGKKCSADKGEFILEVARRNDIIIPTLCHHKALAGQGCCRVCVVEINEGYGNKVVVSCVYPITKPIQVFTETDKIKGIRQTILSMLKGRAPEAVRIKSLAGYYKTPKNTRFTELKGEKCILCGLCTKACEQIGTGAICTVNRGTTKKISTPYDELSPDCIGCLSCASVCPTKAIEYKETDSTRTIWGKKFKLVCCSHCGKAFATAEEYMFAQIKSNPSYVHTGEYICNDCKQKNITNAMCKTYGL